MTDNSSSTPIDLRIKRKRDDIDENQSSTTSTATKKKSRLETKYEIPLDLSVKSQRQQQQGQPVFNPINPSSSSSTPFYDPTSLLFNSSALIYDLFLANLSNYYQQQQQQQQHQAPPPPPPTAPPRMKMDSSISVGKSNKSQTMNSSRLPKDLPSSKQDSYACSCGEKYSNVAHLVSHLKITNHSAQLSSTHDEVAKLVRGQDIWLSRDTNPANQILKCLRCSLSFETLPDLTAHMMKTNHFTQLLPSSSTSTSTTPIHHSKQQQQQQQQQVSPTKFSNSSSLVRSTCLICSQQFAREVDLVDHIQHFHKIRFNCTTCGMYFENENLYKEHILKEMHHRNGKANRNRDYFLNQCKTLQKRSLNFKPERIKSRSPIDKDIEQILQDLIDQVIKKEEEESKVTSSNALSLLQSFVTKQTPNSHRPSDLNNNHYDDENTNISSEKCPTTNLYHHEQIAINGSIKSNENPLVSLEKMLSYPTTTIQSLSSTINDNGTMSNLSNNSLVTMKKKKFDKYRLFAEKMLRSTLS